MKEMASGGGVGVGIPTHTPAINPSIRITVPILTLNARKFLELKSPVGAEAMKYSWPLKKGKGSMRRSEDKQDEAAEILETIRWVCEGNEDIREAMGTDYLSKYDIKSFETMTAICEKYNKAVDKYLKSEKFKGMSGEKLTRVTRPHLKHILQKCYNKSVIDPNELNHYEAFTPEVYGETSFDLICQILDKLHPISGENKFVDLGSGVGQVVLQVAALTTCSMSLGIEKANIPANYAKNLEKFFRFWMAFYGKMYSPFKLVHGDFLEDCHRSEILESTIVFVNNFAFGPEVDQHLKDIFADLNDGARIFSSKSFCALNFRITDRNLSDIGTIMHVSKMDPLKGSVSWTGKPVSYYLHIIDRAKLERYFQKSAAIRKGEGDGDNGGRRGRRGRRVDNNLSNVPSLATSNESSLLGDGNSGLVLGGSIINGAEESGESRDISRASSVDRDENSRTSGIMSNNRRAHFVYTTNNSETEGDDENSNNTRKSSKRPVNFATMRKLTASVKRLTEDENSTSLAGDSMLSAASNENSNDVDGPSSRPMRTVVANAAAISEAQTGLNGKKRKGRPRKGFLTPMDVDFEKNEKVVDSIVGLDNLHEDTIIQINASQNDDSVPHGCVKERLTEFAPRTCLEHVELAESLKSDGQGGHIPYQLQKFLEHIKNEMLDFTNRMQRPEFLQKIEDEIKEEKNRKTELVKREKQLKAQIENLISDSLGLLNGRLGELGINAKNSPEFIEKAKGIVCSHHDLQRKKHGLESEVKELERESENLIKSKELELIEKLLKERNGIRQSQAKDLVRREIDKIMSGTVLGTPSTSSKTSPPASSSKHHDPKVAPFINKLSDVTFTKCPSSTAVTSASNVVAEVITTQIRKRPREQGQKQRDWPEKKHRPNDPEMMSRKIIGDSPMSMDNLRQTSAATLTISPTKPTDNRHRPNPVEVRKIEAESPPYPPSAARISPPKAKALPSVAAAVSAISSSNRNFTNVDLPKIDLAAQMQASSSSTQDLVLPPHPGSRRGSSEHTNNDDLTFAKSRVSTTPRAEQFEDRLKTIIHSVLSSDANGPGGRHSPTKRSTGEPLDIKPPLHLLSSEHSSSSGGQQQQPMFSPVKRELPSHLPPPPNTHTASRGNSGNYPPPHGGMHPHQQQQTSSRQHHHPSYHPSYPPPSSAYSSYHHQKPQMSHMDTPPPHHNNSSRTMNDLIASEIERTMAGQDPRVQPPPPPSSHRRPSYGSMPSSSSGDPRDYQPSGYPHPISRMPGGPESSSPATLTRMTQIIEDSVRGGAPPAAHHGYAPGPPPPLPRMLQQHQRSSSQSDLEGLACPRTKSPPHRSRLMAASPSSSTHPAATSSSAGPSLRTGDYPAMEGLAARFGPYMDKANREQQQHELQQQQQRFSVKRHPTSPPLPSPPVLPPKKQHLDEHPDYRMPKDNTKREWQDAISSGFDRLVAYATEVDKRRKSSDSNSPKRSNNNNQYGEEDTVFANDNNKMSTLSMEFKGAARYQRQLTSSPIPHSATPTGSSSSRAATPQSGGASSRVTTPIGNRKSPLPGENLPEHHPKKRYFAETRDSCSSSGTIYRSNSSHSPPPLGRSSSGLPNAMSSFYPESREVSARGALTPPSSDARPSSSSSYPGVVNKNRPSLR